MALWNARSLNDMTKINFLRIRREDIIIINETWLREEPPSLSGYQCLYKNRPTPQTDDNGPDLNKEQKPDKLRGGGVAIYVDQNIHVKEIETEIKETLFLKISFNRNKCIYLITSYFPHKLEKKWDIRMRQILEKALEKCNENGLRNIVFAGDFNTDLTKESEIIEELGKYNLGIVDARGDTFSNKTTSSKLDFFVISKGISEKTSVKIEEKSMSDHKVVTLKLEGEFEFARNVVKFPNRLAASSCTATAMENCKLSLTPQMEENNASYGLQRRH